MYTKRRFVGAALLIILAFSYSGLYAFYATDILSFIKMTAEFTKQIKSLKQLIKSSKKLNEEFKYFKKRFLRIHKGLTFNELKEMFSIEDIEFYYNNPYVRFNKNDVWNSVWKKNSGKSRLKYISDKSYLTQSKLYKTNSTFRKRIDYKLKGESKILKEYKSVLSMISDTKKFIVERKERYKNIETLIRKVNGQGATGKLLAIQNELRIEQLIKLDLLITALRSGIEMEIKEKLIRMDNYKKSEIDRFNDRRKDLEILKRYFSGD